MSVGPVTAVKGAGSSELGTGNSGPMLGEYPHDQNGSNGASTGPVNQPEQNLGSPTVTSGPEDAIIDTTVNEPEQVGNR